jgi:glycosyltransferase involved in cell wall biosynthesis
LCKKLVLEHELPVTFTGKLEKMEWVALARDHDIFINTTNFDNMPVSVIEAMALGLPVISSNVGGLPYLIDHQTDGMLVPPNDAEAFVNSITQLSNQPELVKDLVTNARKKAERFDWEVVKQQWFRLLEA